MTQIWNQIDGIIRSLKRVDSLSGVRFIRGFGGSPAEIPVAGFLAAVSIVSSERSSRFLGGLAAEGLRGELFSAEAEIRVYAPTGESGSGLSALTGEMLARLSEADEQGIISDASAGAIEFDRDLNAIFRRISFTVSFCLCEEAEQ